MILIGQFDSPFVRRVGIALELYEIPYEHCPWSVWHDSEKIARYNPLRRVPTLVLDNGESLIESAAILDALDERVGPLRSLMPQEGPVRRAGLRIAALASGFADKAVSLFYEQLLHPEASEKWVTRCRTQMREVLTALEAERAPRQTDYWFGNAITHADIAVACAIRFAREAHPATFDLGLHPALAAHTAKCEELAVFQKIAQPFSV